jgi:uncharacterized heparinase superfamily protein
MTGTVRPASWLPRHVRALHRVHARLAGLSTRSTTFISQPEPRTIGSQARGRQLVAGHIRLAGVRIESGGRAPWDVTAQDPLFSDEAQGFRWLDDLAALPEPRARQLAQDWTFGWIDRFGAGSGPGWTPELTGRRLIRMINHAIMLLRGQDEVRQTLFFRALSRQTVFLSRRWRKAPPGLPRFEALTGLIHAGQSLTGMDKHIGPAIAALGRECRIEIDADGGIESRNPEELLDIFSLLTWAASAIGGAGRSPDPEHLSAVDRMAPTLRALRHADGGLARFHGGGRGLEGRLDQALATVGGRARTAHGLAMGYARLHCGRTTVIIDAAPPPTGTASLVAHASTLAFEMTSGRWPVVVNCGAGETFGPDWSRAGRATPSHSTLCIRGFSSSRLGPEGMLKGRRGALFEEAPDQVWAQWDGDFDGQRVLVGHNGYAATHGMTHIRQMYLSVDGRTLSGDDTLGAMTSADRRRFETVVARDRIRGIPFEIRFHLHPDVDASIDLGGTAVSLALKSGDLWVFRHDGVADMTLAPSVYLQSDRLSPRAGRQIVLSASVIDYACQISWTFSKAQDTAAASRESGADEEAQPHDPDA